MDAFLVDAVRTPRGAAREGGGLSAVKPIDLLAALYAALDARLGAALGKVDDVVLGCVTPVGEQGANLAKISSLYAGLPTSISGVTLNRFCASGLDAIVTAALKVHGGFEPLVLAGGVESQSRAPMLSDGGAWFADADVAAKTKFIHMGVAADVVATLAGVTREQADAFALRSHQRAAKARDEGRFTRSLIALHGLAHDEWVRPTTSLASLAKLPPAFADMGAMDAIARAHTGLPKIEHVHSVATAPGRVDGAALTVVANQRALDELGLKPRARIVAYANASDDPVVMLRGGLRAAERALAHAKRSARDVDLWEVNESFSATVIDFCRALDLDEARVNVNGGAIALGHALGATGAVLTGTLLDELERQDKRTGVVAICAGAGIGQALVVERIG